jgi:hypothetical protein
VIEADRVRVSRELGREVRDWAEAYAVAIEAEEAKEREAKLRAIRAMASGFVTSGEHAQPRAAEYQRARETAVMAKPLSAQTKRRCAMRAEKRIRQLQQEK